MEKIIFLALPPSSQILHHCDSDQPHAYFFSCGPIASSSVPVGKAALEIFGMFKSASAKVLGCLEYETSI